MRKLILITLGVFIIQSIQAQQNVQYTQFMYSKLWMNPGYAGSHDVSCIQAIARNQWIGFEGAPESQSFNYHTPLFGNKVGVGLSLNHDRLGPTESWFLNMSYAYRIKTAKGRLAVGLQANFTQYTLDYRLLNPTENGDGQLPVEKESKMLPNFGVGVYYSSDKFFAGISMPLLMEGDLSFAEGDAITESLQARHMYFMAGMIHKISSNVKGRPSVLLKKVTNAPFDFDLNYSLIFMERLWAGLSYRLGGDVNSSGESIDLTLQYQLSRGLRIGAAYDFTLSDLKNANDGSIEFMAQMCMSQKSEKLTNPRFF